MVTLSESLLKPPFGKKMCLNLTSQVSTVFRAQNQKSGPNCIISICPEFPPLKSEGCEAPTKETVTFSNANILGTGVSHSEGSRKL